MVLLGYRHTIILHNKKAGIMLLPWYVVVVVRALRGELGSELVPKYRSRWLSNLRVPWH
jgi:hypothetical protein